jgi:hypothetical protein
VTVGGNILSSKPSLTGGNEDSGRHPRTDRGRLQVIELQALPARNKNRIHDFKHAFCRGRDCSDNLTCFDPSLISFGAGHRKKNMHLAICFFDRRIAPDIVASELQCQSTGASKVRCYLKVQNSTGVLLSCIILATHSFKKNVVKW